MMCVDVCIFVLIYSEEKLIYVSPHMNPAVVVAKKKQKISMLKNCIFDLEKLFCLTYLSSSWHLFLQTSIELYKVLYLQSIGFCMEFIMSVFTVF